MPIEAVKIPQNVYVEDRIVGPLSLRQVMIVTLGGGGSYAIWSSLLKAYGQISIVTTIIVWIPAVLAFAFAFIRVNDLSLLKILFLKLERMRKPVVRAFGPRTGISITIRTFTTEKAKVEPPAPSVVAAKEKKLEELSSILDISPLGETASINAPVPTNVADPMDANPALEPLVKEAPASPIPVTQSRVQVSETPADAPGVDGIQARSSIFSNRSPSHA